MNIEQAHVIASNLEQKIKENLEIESTIHIDPDSKSGEARTYD